MAFYWSMLIRFQLLFLTFLRSIREGSWKLNVSCRMSLMKYVFIMDRTNYCRWMSVDLHDDQQLPSVCPDTYKHHVSGGFVIQKSNRKGSAIHGDQGHEQNNDLFKDGHGQLGSELNLRWVVAGPECKRICDEFEEYEESPDPKPHHEDNPSRQKLLYKDVNSLFHVIMESCNPWSCGEYMYFINNGEMMENSHLIGVSIRSLEARGEEAYQEWRNAVLIAGTRPITAAIKEQKVILPSTVFAEEKSACFRGTVFPPNTTPLSTTFPSVEKSFS